MQAISGPTWRFGMWIVLVAALTILVPIGCARGDAPLPPRNVVLISVDTLRADFLGSYGHPYVQSPSIDGVAEQGLLFERHIASAPTTLASHTALMTGTWPHTHGVPRNGFEVHTGNLMLAEVLKSSGFETAGFIGAFPLSARFSFNQGFDHWDEAHSTGRERDALDQAQRPANEVTDAVLGWVAERSSEAPLFLFVHYYDVHAPYTPPGKYSRLYREDASEIRGTMAELKTARAELEQKRPTELQDILRRQYAAGVTWVDSEIGRLLAGLEAEGILEDAVLVITSDHGEAMDEHWEYWNHGFATYDTTVRVPLVIRLPKGYPKGRRIDSLVSNIDVMPTLLEILGLAIPPTVEGQSFLVVMRGNAAAATREIAFSEATKPFASPYEGDPVWKNARKARSAQSGSWKVVHVPLRNETELYDVGADPGEQVDRSAAEPERTERLLERLATWGREARPRDGRHDIDPEVQKQLEALGYGAEPMPER